MKYKISPILCAILITLLALVLILQPVTAQTPAPVVQAVLFYSPYCSHCIYVITEFLPGIFEQYGGQLELFMVNVTLPEGQVLFIDATQALGYDGGSIPFLVVGDTYLVGDVEIPLQLPGLIDSHLASGGISWPDLPGLADYMSAERSTQLAALLLTPEFTSTVSQLTAEQTPQSIPPTLQSIPTVMPELPTPSDDAGTLLAEMLARDPIGNTLAILVLVGMLIALGWSVWYILKKPGAKLSRPLSWLIFILCLLGLGVAGYLAYVETLHVDAYCGLVGDCNTVQQSEYARLFGILPIGILGVMGYLLILAALACVHFIKGKWADYASLALFVLTTFATLFSIYLTFLEPFVIGATCLWCLTSAVISTILMLFSIPPGKLALARLTAKQA
jgi:uncharacterized membrane protein